MPLKILKISDIIQKKALKVFTIFFWEEIQSIFAVGAAASTKLFDVIAVKIQGYLYKFRMNISDVFDKLMEKEIFNFYNQCLEVLLLFCF